MTRGGEDVDPTDVGVPVIPDEPPPVVPQQRSVDPGQTGPVASAESRRQCIAGIYAVMGWSASMSDVERAAMRSRQCPTCRQPKGQGCVVPGTTRARKVHESRLRGKG